MTSLWRHSRLTYYDLGLNFLTQGVELLAGEVWQVSKRNSQYFRSYLRKNTGGPFGPHPQRGGFFTTLQGMYHLQGLSLWLCIFNHAPHVHTRNFPCAWKFNIMLKGIMPPCIDHMELVALMQRADFSEHIQRFKLHGNPLNFPHFDASNTKFAPTGYRCAPNIISHHYKQQLSAKASMVPKARPIRFR